MPDSILFVADRGDARLRLDQVLVRRVTGITRLSRSMAQQWIESGAVTVDRQTARRSSARVREGASVEVRLPAPITPKSRPEAEPGDLRILYEDDSLLAIDKPPGIVVHPSYKQLRATLLNNVLWRVRDRADARPGILTRLDKDTSGVVIVPLTSRIHALMQRDGAAGRIRKEYLAIVCGAPRPRSGRIREPLARDPQDRRRVVVTAGGAACETLYEVITSRSRAPLDAARSATARRAPTLSLVRCELITGRTHQIRVHLAFKGWPVLGDRVYGTADDSIDRQALHAWRVAFPHPLTRDPVAVEAPVPEDMRRLGVD
jgi:23S rRNA pseudouridine1911/1915/1917 synthase